jgi:hypothetical protein
VAFTPDGKTLLTASTDPEEPVTAWDAATGRRGQELSPPHGPLHATGPSVPFVVTPAGAVVTTGKGTIVWTDRKTGRELRRVTPQPIVAARDKNDTFHQERLSLARDPQTGRPVVLGLHIFGPALFVSPEPTHRWKLAVTVWDAESGELFAHRVEVLSHYDHNGAALSPDGRLQARALYVSATDAAVELSPSLGGRASVRLVHPGEFAPRYTFAADGQSLVTAARKRPPEEPGARSTEANTVRVWEVRTGQPRLEFALSFEPAAIAVSPDGRLLAAARADTRTILLFDLATGIEVARRGGYHSLVETLAFRPDGRALASGHDDGTALVWDLSGLPGGTPGAADREDVWADLASADAATAYRAMRALAADPKGVAYLRDRVKPQPDVPAARLRALVNDLDADRYATREAATSALQKLGDVADGELRAMLRGGLTAEQQRRLTDVLAGRLLTEPDPDQLRALRAVEVLERVGTTEADALLAELAKGARGARLTRAADDAAWRRGLSSR